MVGADLVRPLVSRVRSRPMAGGVVWPAGAVSVDAGAVPEVSGVLEVSEPSSESDVSFVGFLPRGGFLAGFFFLGWARSEALEALGGRGLGPRQREPEGRRGRGA